MAGDFRRVAFLVLVLAVAAAWVATAAGAIAQPALTSLDIKSPMADDIRAAAAGSQRARVTVMLAGDETTHASGDRNEDIGALVGAVRRTVDGVLADHFGNAVSAGGGLGLTRAEAHPVFTLNATLAEIEALAADPRVRSITLDFAMEPGLTQTIPLIGMPAAYADSNATGAGFAVAIVDTGVDWTHQWFTGRLVGEGCFSGGGDPARSLCPGAVLATIATGAGLPCGHDAGCDHGTHVAGIATGRNLLGPAPPHGISRDGLLIAYKVFSGPGLSAFNSDLIAGLSSILARRNSFGAPVAAVNMSLNNASLAFAGACDGLQPALTAVIKDLKNAGIATVISAGNQGQVGQMTFPACITDAIAVANSTKGDAIAASSNLSAMTDLVAPGTSITAPVPLNGFAVKTGTSMAAPHVAGLFAALRSACAVPFTAAGVDLMLATMRGTGKAVADQRPGGVFAHPRIRADLAAATLCTPANAPGNNMFVAADRIGAGDTIDATNAGANREAGEPGHAGRGGLRSVWWLFEAPVSFTVTISTEGSEFDTLLAVYTGEAVAGLTEVAANDDVNGGVQSAVAFDAVAGTTYRIAVDGFGGAAGRIRLAVSDAPDPEPTAVAAGGLEPLSLLALGGVACWARRRRPR